MDQYKKKLFGTFPPVSTEDWEAKIIEDLKGADYNKKLIWKTNEGFDVKPYYRQEDLQNSFHKPNTSEYDYLRGINRTSNSWEIRQDIETDDLEEANTLALDAIKRGATALSLVVSEVDKSSDFNILLKDIDVAHVNIHYTGADSNIAIVKILSGFLKDKTNGAELRGSFDFDPFSNLILNGEFNESEKDDLAKIPEMIKLGKQLVPNMKMINVNGHYFNSAAATLTQELAYSLASGAEYIQQCVQAGISVDDVAPRIMFSFGLGSSYFMEIARLRAARILWAKIVEQYNPSEESAKQMYIHCNTSAWNKSLYDPYVNMLRTTTESMSAVMGGAQSLSVLPFDTFYKDPDAFSNRIARNQQVILKEESYLDKVVDPAAGSYYIEALTSAIAEAAWKLFLEVEEKGGMLAAIKSGFIQDCVEASANERIKDIATRKTVALGTNQYPNLNEKMLDKINFSEDEETDEEMYANENDEVNNDEDEETTYKKITLFGATDVFDQLRLATEQYEAEGNKRPSVFLFNIGNLAMRKARAMFATNFFGCAGYEIIDNNGFNTVDEGIKAALSSKADIITICSSDDEYATLGVEIAGKLKSKMPESIIVIAGYPKEILETLQKAGVEEFIHVRSNLLETLEKFQEKLGIF